MPAEAASQPSATPLTPSMGDGGDFVRLHITPLDSELLKIVIPASVLPVARNISYHTIETFPERRYGFVDLPQTDAEKLKRKLNGAVLKGCKMRIEKARPERRVEPTAGEVDTTDKKKKSSKDGSEGSKKRKREADVLEGVALKDRKVKRGWTEAPPTTYKKKSKKDKDSKDQEKRKRPKSKYTDQEECLLKTKLPLSAVRSGAPAEETDKDRRKKKGSSRHVTVHEFERTTKFPSFLKTSTADTGRKPATEFVDGKGWVDEEGNVVEPVKQREAPVRPAKTAPPKPAVEEDEDDDSTSSSGTSSDDDTSSEEEESEDEEVTQAPAKAQSQDESDSETSSEGENESETSDDSDSESDSSEDERSPQLAAQGTPLSAKKANDPKQPSSSGPSKTLAIKIPPPETPSASKTTAVHPLEALYKKPKPDSAAPTQTPAPQDAEPFSFFGGGGSEGEDDAEQEEPATVPMTPFTRQDYEWRNIRSAAPTPDTAHPTRMQNFWAGDVDMEDAVEEEQEEEAGEEEGENGDDGEEAPAVKGQQQATSDFQKWFWENRRELNRSWMSRRKTAAKEKRHRENKARAFKAV